MTNRIPTPPDARTVIVGVDTHKHVHVAVAIDSWGIRQCQGTSRPRVRCGRRPHASTLQYGRSSRSSR